MAIVDLVMPKLGESIIEATILNWNKKVGDAVKQDETVLEIATDKVDSEVPSTHAGTITEILFNVNDVVPIGTVIARIDTGGSNANISTPAPQPVTQAPAPIQETPQPAQPTATVEVPYTPPATETTIPRASGSNNKFYSPLVLNIANSEGVNLSELENIAGTGADGRVSKKDILQYIADKRAGKVAPPQPQVAAAPVATTAPTQTVTTPEPVATPQPTAEPIITAAPQQQPATIISGNVEIIEMDRMRKLIAKHMVDSKHTSPHVTSFTEADVTNMVLWRDRVKKQFEKQVGSKITFTPMFIECITRVMKRFPMINASLDGDKIIIKKDFNIGMATALPSGNLIVPVIKGADMLNLVGLSKTVNNLADAARNNKLKPDDTQGGTFTLTNVGTFGSLMGTPIINQPQVAILAVGAIKKRPVVVETPEGDTIGIRHMMYLSMSYDHRIVDGSLGASFLTAVGKELEKWDIHREW
ncbi:MAG: 2-oxo acid dehydrogenase subunit E2 [Chitinophagaceae bacterium]|nr:2-oxo acid dehydrogenase subunit E2 [Chitinophagaceae bacterium]MCW5905979.1 2-oxo acid dehydrogenase subunit E2 [Chitinophagaceae bacterium]